MDSKQIAVLRFTAIFALLLTVGAGIAVSQLYYGLATIFGLSVLADGLINIRMELMKLNNK